MATAATNTCAVFLSYSPQALQIAFAGDGDGGDGFGDSGGWGGADYEDDGSLGGAGDLLEAPRKVEKISVTYSKASKQVC